MENNQDDCEESHKQGQDVPRRKECLEDNFQNEEKVSIHETSSYVS